MKHIYLTFVCFLITGFVFAQQSSIKGTITDIKTGEPITDATVYLKPFKTAKGVSTDLKGNYILNNISKGTYILHISFLGFETIEEELILGENERIVKNYRLEEAIFELQDVEIVGRKRTGYRPDVTYAGTKVAMNIKDIPQSIAIINKEIIKDQGLFRLNEVVVNVAGVTRTRANDNFTSRGFSIRQDFINGNRAFTSVGFASSSIATQYERIEFIKGPATALFGNSAPGGVINAVTKKPLKENRAFVSASIGGFSELDDLAIKRVTLDITGPLNEEKTLLYRMNVARENSDSFIDFIQNNSVLFAPSISYLPSDKTRINVDFVGSFNNDQAGLSEGRGIPVLQNDLFALPINFNPAEPYDYRQNGNTILTVAASHKFSDILTFNTSYTRSDVYQDFLETRSSNTLTPDGTEIIRQINQRRATGNSDFITAYVVANFKTGAIKHKALFGWDYYERENAFDNRSATGESNGVPNLVFNNRIPIENIEDLSVNFDERTRSNRGNQTYKGFYLQDLIEVGKFKFLAALRYEKLGTINTILNSDQDVIDDDVFLPRLGITYTLNEQVNLYASYTEGFEQQLIPGLVNALRPGEAFDPRISDQIEIGTKTSFFKNKLLAQVSLYHINRSGRVLADPSGANFFALQLGNEKSSGAELELTGNITSNFTLTANYAFNEVSFSEQDLINLRNLSSLIGTGLSNNPKHTGGFWGKYTFKNTIIKNLDVGFGGSFVSDNQLFNTALNRVSEFFTFPSYFILNQRVGYKYKNMDISLNINNILDERYYVGEVDIARVFPGAPRSFLFTLGYNF